jgi:hypothetical protein
MIENRLSVPHVRVSNAAASSTAPTKSHDWRNIPQPRRDPAASEIKEADRKEERNLPTAPPVHPPHEAA